MAFLSTKKNTVHYLKAAIGFHLKACLFLRYLRWFFYLSNCRLIFVVKGAKISFSWIQELLDDAIEINDFVGNLAGIKSLITLSKIVTNPLAKL